MEQQPGQDPDHDGPADPHPGAGRSRPGRPSFPDDAASPAQVPVRPAPALPGHPAPISGLGGPAATARATSARGTPWRARSGWRRSGRSCCPGSPRAGAGISTRPARSSPPPSRRPQARTFGARRRPGEEKIGLLRAMAALQSWSGAGMLGVIRALIRDDDQPYLGRSKHGDLPDGWDDSLLAEISLALAVSLPSAEKTTRAAWELGARLPGVELLLRDGTLDVPRARLITEVFAELSDENAARAEELLLPELTAPPRKTYTQIERIATAIAAAVDPGLAERRRKAAEKHRARVAMFREQSGDCRPVGPGPARRRDAGRLRQPRRPRSAVQGLRRVPGRAPRPPPRSGLPGHPQWRLRRRPDRLRSPRLRRRPQGRSRSRRPRPTPATTPTAPATRDRPAAPDRAGPIAHAMSGRPLCAPGRQRLPDDDEPDDSFPRDGDPDDNGPDDGQSDGGGPDDGADAAARTSEDPVRRRPDDAALTTRTPATAAPRSWRWRRSRPRRPARRQRTAHRRRPRPPRRTRTRTTRPRQPRDRRP